MSETSEAEYKPELRMRVSIVGMLRNASEELESIFRRNEHTRLLHAESVDSEEHCDCDICDQQDWTGFYAESLRQTADNMVLLDKNPSGELFEFADLYALHGLAAHIKRNAALTRAHPTSQEKGNG